MRIFVSMLSLRHLCLAGLTATVFGVESATNVAGSMPYTNPILPGWNSDPSCTFVPAWDNTFFCTTSSFLAFPGCPLFASKDLTNWKLASHALNRPEQLPELSSTEGQNEGLWASTIRFRNGTFYLITGYITFTPWAPKILLFTTTDPYDDASWSDPIWIQNPANDIDPDLFWDDDGQLYMSVAAGIYISKIDVSTGAATEPFTVWNGTGERNPEGPHIYRKDDYYYLLVGEGGTETNHSVTIARASDLRGPYEGYDGNPILTAKNTDNYFQTVGHADLFQDATGNWWGAALATRSGPAWEMYPMGRETVLFPVTWEQGEWPVLDEVRGSMSGPLPPTNKDLPGDGPFVGDPDIVDFAPGSKIPRNFIFWRPPITSLFSVSSPGHPNTLQISPSRVNLTADAAFEPATEGLAFIARKQTSTLFEYSVDVSFNPGAADEEAGVTVFLTQLQHIDLGLVNLPDSSGCGLMPKLRFRVEASGKPNVTVPETKIVDIPTSWLSEPIRLSVNTTTATQYTFSAAPVGKDERPMMIGDASALIVSGGSGPFTGTIIGAYATSNSGEGATPAFFSRWRYTPIAQEIDAGVFVPA